MNALADLLAYLKAESRRDAVAPPAAAAPQPFITISRQAGAGATTLAKAFLDELSRRGDEPVFRGWRVYDRELCEAAAKDANLAVSLESLLDEIYHPPFTANLVRILGRGAPQSEAVLRVFHCVAAAARLGKAVVIGRGGNCLTRGLPLGIHVRLVASEGTRVAALRRRYGLERAGAERKLAELDASRARLIRLNFGRDIDDPLLYDAVWNTDAVTHEEIAAVLAMMVRDACVARPGRVFQDLRFAAGRPAAAPSAGS